MKFRILAASAAALSTLAMSGVAHADVTVLGSTAGNLSGTLLHAQSYLWDFDTIFDSNFTFSSDTATNFVHQGADMTNISAPPPVPGANPGDPYVYETTKYESVQGGGSATFQALGTAYLTGFSFYLGSPDTYNHLRFAVTSAEGGTTTLSGSQIWNDPDGANGDQTWGRRVYYGFGGDHITSITFTSDSNAFEFDGLAGNVGGVPEPASWALMILGFGATGVMLRSRRRQAVATA